MHTIAKNSIQILKVNQIKNCHEIFRKTCLLIRKQMKMVLCLSNFWGQEIVVNGVTCNKRSTVNHAPKLLLMFYSDC